ncbi:MAG: hypothetical protein K6T71_00020 [Candidatus Bipolaricaulota bacterium]|nr:hypothetical protein [Candidatus Bipolaricaulota bacterium]
MNSFERVYARLERRQRLLHGLSALSGTLLITLGLTAIALIVSVFVSPISPVWWLGGNLVLASLAFVWGWFRPLDMTSTIFRADRNAHCDEKLITLYELSLGQGPKEFLPLLVSRLETLRLDLSTALPITERWRWLGVLALALLCAGMTSVVPPGGFLWGALSESTVSTRPSQSAPISQQEARTAELLQTPPTAIAEKLPALRSRLEQARAALAQNPNDARARAILHQLQEEIRQEQNRLLNPPLDEQAPPPAAEKSSDDASLVEDPAGDVRTDRPPQGQSALDRLMQALRELQGQAQGLSPEEMQKLLEQLQQENPEAVSIAQRALQTAQNDEEFSKRLEEALKNLEARRDLHQQLEQLQREAQSALSQPEPPQTARSQTPGSPDESAQPSQEGTQDSQETDSEESPEGARQENARPSGGRGQAPLDPEAVKDLPDLSQLRERTRSTSVPAPQEENLEILFEIVSIGLPQNPDTPGQPTLVQIDYQKVEALIDALEIPVELREAVRQYFLSLARR